MEYLQVFDENKVARNEKVPRKEKYNLTEGKYFMIVLIFIENSEGKFLLQKTSKSRHSCIATTGGHVTFGDNAFETVIKECREELGLIIKPFEIKYIDTSVFGNCFLETFYLKKDINIMDLVLQKEEVESVKWFSTEEILDLINKNELREGNIEPFKKVLEYIGK